MRMNDIEYIPTHVHGELGEVRYLCEEDEAVNEIPGIDVDIDKVCQVIVLEGEHEGIITTVDKDALSRVGNLHQVPADSYEDMKREYSPYAMEDLMESKGADTLHDHNRHEQWLREQSEAPADFSSGPKDRWDEAMKESYEEGGVLADLVDRAREDYENGNTKSLPGSQMPNPSFPMEVEITGPDEEGDWTATVPKWSMSAFGPTPSEALKELGTAMSLYETEWSNVPAGTEA